MNWKSLWCLGVSICLLTQSVGPAVAQVKIERPGGNTSWIYHMTVDPAVETDPALRYRLLLGAQDRRPGNSAPYYYRAIALLNGPLGKELSELYGDVQRLENSSKHLTEFPTERVRQFLAKCQAVLNELELASGREYCDWGVKPQEMNISQTISMTLAEFQECRRLAWILRLQAHLAIVDHQFDQALLAIQRGLQIGRDVAECPTILCSLIGAAVVQVMTVPLADLTAEPHAPNLYWALASTPRPFIDLRNALDYELNWVFKVDLIRQAEQPHTPEEWKRLFVDAYKLVDDLGSNRQAIQSAYFKSADGTDLNPQVAAMQLALKEYPRAKQELARFGFKPEQIEEMPVIQVIAIFEARLAQHLRDDVMKWTYLPYNQGAPLIQALERHSRPQSNPARISDLREALPLFDGLRPSIGQVMLANVRLDRRLIRIQIVEALRHHAAVNDRMFPATLAEIKGLPVPVDPVTAQPVVYRLDGETAVLEFPLASIPAYGEVIRINLRKAP